MCGIIGVIYGPDGPEAEEWTPSEFAQMMFPAIVRRGPHAYGWMYSRNGEITTHVAKGRCDTKRAIRSMDIPDDVQWMVGHVRWATHGDPANLLNNHPIEHGDIVGVHNGVIYNYKDILAETGRVNEAREVDSEAIFAAVNKWGHQSGLKRIKGDMVAVYADKRFPDSLRIARTQGRPLVMCKTPTGAVFFASIEQAIDATGIEHMDYTTVSQYRILTLKGGLITKRQNIPHEVESGQEWGAIPVGTGWTRTRPHYAEGDRPLRPASANLLRTPRMQKAFQALADANIELPSSGEDPPKKGKIHRTPQQNQIVQKDGTFDRASGLYWYNGILVDLDSYIDAIVGEAIDE
jgi:hypothetical protein